MKKFKQIIYLLSKNEKKRAVQLFLMVLIMATFDVAGVASILPFVAVLSNPAVIETSNFISSLYNFSNNFGINSNTEFLFFLGIIFFLLLLLSLSFKAFTIYVQLRFITMRESCETKASYIDTHVLSHVVQIRWSSNTMHHCLVDLPAMHRLPRWLAQ